MHTIVCALAAMTVALFGAGAIYSILLCRANKTYAKNYLLRTLSPAQYAEYRAEVQRSKQERSTIFWGSFIPLGLVSYKVIQDYINKEYVEA